MDYGEDLFQLEVVYSNLEITGMFRRKPLIASYSYLDYKY